MTQDSRKPADFNDPSLFVNREMGLLQFQERVLEEVLDPANPLLERAKFFAILSSNLAEFFMVRLAGLKQQVGAGVSDLSPDGLSPAEQLEMTRAAVGDLMTRGRAAFRGIRKELAAEGIHLHDYDKLNEEQRQAAEGFYRAEVFPVLTPLAFDPGRPFPHISNLSLNLAILVRSGDGEVRFARVKIPRALPRLVPVPVPPDEGDSAPGHVSREHHFVWLEQLVVEHLDTLFPGMEVLEAHPFRVTRDAEMAIQELEADDLLATIEDGIRRRRFGSVVRVTITPEMPANLQAILLDNLAVTPDEVVTLDSPLGGSNLMSLYKLDRPDLKDPPFVPAMPEAFDSDEAVDVFALVRERDFMLHRPFESFDPVVRLIRQAAKDPDVLAIKMTLYRVGRDSPVVKALLDAALEGKEVTALVELKARFDEESNIEWAKALEAQGVHVVYGLVGLKTHSKICLIVRREAGRLRRYLHMGTGNYNTVTAALYTDLDLITCDEEMCADASALFNFLTGYAEASPYQCLYVAPIDLRERFTALVDREIEHANAGRPARMVLKMNSLVDPAMIKALYRASQAGVEVELIVRGICCLRPGVPGASENIRVTSIVGRFLEHTRIYLFANDGEPECLIGSADLMTRNLDRRVEVVAPVKDPALIDRLENEVLGAYLSDNVKARRMLPDGSFERVVAQDEVPFDAQDVLMRSARR